MVRREEGNSSVEVEEEVKNKGIKPLLKLCPALDHSLPTWSMIFFEISQLQFSSWGLIYYKVHSPAGVTSPETTNTLRGPSILGFLLPPFRYQLEFSLVTYGSRNYEVQC